LRPTVRRKDRLDHGAVGRAKKKPERDCTRRPRVNDSGSTSKDSRVYLSWPQYVCMYDVINLLFQRLALISSLPNHNHLCALFWFRKYLGTEEQLLSIPTSARKVTPGIVNPPSSPRRNNWMISIEIHHRMKKRLKQISDGTYCVEFCFWLQSERFDQCSELLACTGKSDFRDGASNQHQNKAIGCARY